MNLESLPTEIIFQILYLLPPTSLASATAVSKKLRGHACDDLLWEFHVRSNLDSAQPLSLPLSVQSWRDLYGRHHPYWFIVRHRIWHADSDLRGNILFTHYEATSGSILAYTILGRDRAPSMVIWPNPAAFGALARMSLFRPEIQLWTQEPTINMNLNSRGSGRRLQNEVDLPMTHDLHARLMLCIDMPPEKQHKSMSLWPPWTLPAVNRVRNESSSKFSSEQHRPRSLSEASDRAFRIRTWAEFTRALPLLNSRIGERLTTWSALSSKTYSQTKEKPWQGIWIGDYSTHGCEFLLVMQSRALPCQQRINVPESESGLPSGYLFENTETLLPGDGPAQRDVEDGRSHEKPGPFNRLEAVKLTGDPNIPRGQCTWLAEDISAVLREVPDSDEVFGGAKIVASHIHIADSGFRDDRYVESELILQDHDHISQHWSALNHISSYRRVNIDSLIPQACS